MTHHENRKPVTVPGTLSERLQAEPGVWTTTELSALGLSSRTIKTLRDAGTLLRVQRGAYALRSTAESLRHEGRAALRLAGHQKVFAHRRNSSFVYSHCTAARLRRFELWHADEYVHVTCPSNACPDRLGSDVVTHQIPLAREEIEPAGLFEMTSLERTVVDCCRILDLEGALVVMDQALRVGADRSLLEDYADRLKGQRGVVNLRQVLKLGDARSESMGETRTRFLLWMMDLALPVSQFEVPTDRGVRRLDFAWPDRKVALEFDGRSKYFGEIPTDEAIADERVRERRLMEQGWIFVRIDWEDLKDPAGVKHRIHAAWSKAKSREAA